MSVSLTVVSAKAAPPVKSENARVAAAKVVARFMMPLLLST
jgi:hypothetical protein